MGRTVVELAPKDQRWFHHPEIRRRVEGSEMQFHAGRMESTRTPREAQALLDRLKKPLE